MSEKERAALASRARACVRRPDLDTRWSMYVPDPWERARLVATLGATLAGMRHGRGLSTRRLAKRAAVARSTVVRLESGQRRPRPVILGALASGMEPGAPEPLRAALIEAAGDSLRPDTETGLRAHRKRAMAAALAGDKPLPPELAHRIACHKRAAQLRRRAHEILHTPGAMHDAHALHTVGKLMDRARDAEKHAGGMITLVIGRHRFTYGAGW